MHDIDDFYPSGLVPLDQLLLGMPQRERLIKVAYCRWEEADRVINTLRPPRRALHSLSLSATVSFARFASTISGDGDRARHAPPFKHSGLAALPVPRTDVPARDVLLTLRASREEL